MPQSAYALSNEDFINNVQVVCPKCREKAVVLGGQPHAPLSQYEQMVQFSCIACGFALKYVNTPKFSVHINSKGHEVKARVLIKNAPYDPYFGFDLWYSTETSFGLLWAYNLAHLTVIENYITAVQRERNRLLNQNNNIGNQLPQWVKDAKNRGYVLRMIRMLK